MREVSNWIGVDRNATGHVAVVSDPRSGKVFKLGKQTHYVHNKYRAMRKELQEAGKYRKVKAIRSREQRMTILGFETNQSASTASTSLSCLLTGSTSSLKPSSRCNPSTSLSFSSANTTIVVAFFCVH